MVLAIAALFALLVWYGTVEPSPERNHYPDEDELGDDYEDLLDERVAVDGTVFAGDPPVLEIEHAAGPRRFELRGGPDVRTGQRVRVYGTVRRGYVLEVHEAVVTDARESWYVYGVSALAALWVAARAARQWRFDAARLGFVPRAGPRTAAAEEPAAARGAGGDRDG